MLLLDTNVCIAVLKGEGAVVARLEQHDPAELCLCSVVKAELYYGARASEAVARNLASVERFVAPFLSLGFDDECARIYGQLRAELRRLGQPIGPNDTMIAAIALSHQRTLVTHNTQEFGRVPGLQLEDWQET